MILAQMPAVICDFGKLFSLINGDNFNRGTLIPNLIIGDKVGPSLYLTPCHETMRSSGGISPHVLKFGTREMEVSSYLNGACSYSKRKGPRFPLDRRLGEFEIQLRCTGEEIMFALAGTLILSPRPQPSY